MSVSQRFIDFMNAHVAPVARRMENQPHISAIRERFYCSVTILNCRQLYYDFANSAI